MLVENKARSDSCKEENEKEEERTRKTFD